MMEYGYGRGFAEKPKPSMSGAITRHSAVSLGQRRCQSNDAVGNPCTHTTAGPRPSSR
jgi:hypothetical protein